MRNNSDISGGVKAIAYIIHYHITVILSRKNIKKFVEMS